MHPTNSFLEIQKITQAANDLLPKFLADPTDGGMSGGNVAICVIDSAGEVQGKIWGNDKQRGRSVMQTAWRKASQVWMTGYPTQEFEKMVFNNELDPDQFGIMHPDFIGWQGGWPALINGEKFAIAISGMRGETDSAMVREITETLGGTILAN